MGIGLQSIYYDIMKNTTKNLNFRAFLDAKFYFNLASKLPMDFG